MTFIRYTPVQSLIILSSPFYLSPSISHLPSFPFPPLYLAISFSLSPTSLPWLLSISLHPVLIPLLHSSPVPLSSALFLPLSSPPLLLCPSLSFPLYLSSLPKLHLSARSAL